MPLKSPTEKQLQIIWAALTALAVAAMIALGAVAVWGLGKILHLLSPVLWPLAIAAVVACLLSPVVDFFERRKVSRARATLLVFALAVTVVVAVLGSVIPKVVEETEQLAAQVPEYSHRLQAHINSFLAHPPDMLRPLLPAPSAEPGPDGKTGTPALASVTGWLTSNLPEMGEWLLQRVSKLTSGFGLLAGLVLIPVYVFHFLLEKRKMETRWKDYLPYPDSSAEHEFVFVFESIGQYLVAFFRGQVLVALCSAVLYTAGFLVAGLNYAFLLGFMAVFLTMIPFIGAIVICTMGLFLAFVQYGDWLHPLWVLTVFGVVQTLEAVFISPKIMGNRVGLHPLIIIIAVMTGTTLLGGVLGGVLAIPLAAALRVILGHYVWKKPMRQD